MVSLANRPLSSMQVLFQDGKFQWKRLENLIGLAREGSGGLDLSDTVRDGARVLLLDEKLRRQLLLALTEDNRLHVEVHVTQHSSLNRRKASIHVDSRQSLLILPRLTHCTSRSSQQANPENTL